MRLFILPLLLAAIPLEAQSAQDSARVIELRKETAKLKVREDSLFKEACRNGIVTASGGCSGSAGSPRVTYIRRHTQEIRRSRLRVDSILATILVPVVTPAPANQAPTASFTVSCVGSSCTFDARASTDDKGIASYAWRSTPPKTVLTGAVVTRPWIVGDSGWAEVLTVTDSAGLSASVSRQVFGPPAPPPPDTVVTPIAGLPELPRVVPAFRDPYPGRACTVTIASGGNINAALSAARGGQVICLAENASFAHVAYPARAASDTGWIVIRKAGTLPPEGTRVTPSTAIGYPTLSTASADPTLTTTPGTHGWYLAGVRITTTAPMTYNLAVLGSSGAEQDVMAEVPQRLVFSRVLLDGGAANVQRCIALNSGETAIVDSWLANCHIKGAEGHGIGSWNGPGPYLIRNTTVEAAGINIMVGGATPSIPNLRTLDLTIQRVHLYKPLAWRGVWTVKNLLELKNAGRVLIEEIVAENSWLDAQTGIGILFKSSNDQGTCSWCQTSDVTFTNSIVRNVEEALSMNAAENYCRAASDEQVGPGKWCQLRGEIPPAIARIHIRNVVFDDVGRTSGGRAVQLTPGHSTTGASDVLLERTIFTQGANKTVGHGLLIAAPGTQRAVFRDNVWTHAMYPILSGEGLMGVTAWTTGAPSGIWSNMCLVKSPNHTDGTPAMPPGTTIVTSEAQCALAAQIHATVQQAVAGVVITP